MNKSGRRAHAFHLLVRDAQQLLAPGVGIDDHAAEVVGRGAGNRDQRGVDQAAGGGLGNGQGFHARLQQRTDGVAETGERLHALPLQKSFRVREKGLE